MAKPICVMYFNPEIDLGNGRKPIIHDMNEMIEAKFPNYHTIALPSHQSMDGSCEEIRFEVFNSDKLEDTSFEEFKKELLENLLVT